MLNDYSTENIHFSCSSLYTYVPTMCQSLCNVHNTKMSKSSSPCGAAKLGA